MDIRKWMLIYGALGALSLTGGCASVVRNEDAVMIPQASVSKEQAPRESIAPTAKSVPPASSPATVTDQGTDGLIDKRKFSFFGEEFLFFGEIGQSNYEKPPCSLWHHECGGYETEWGMRPSMFRIGVEYSGLRLSYFDLGKYSIKANACDDEGFVLHGGGRNCPTDTDWYYSSGSMRGFALSYRYRFLGFWVIEDFFIEGGLAKFRQHFKIEKDDGFSYQERLWGPGYLLGFGIEGKHVGVGYYVYNTKVGGKFEDCNTPSGTGGAHVVTIEFKF